MSVVDDLIGKTEQIKETIGESLSTTRTAVEKILETGEELGSALTAVEQAMTGARGLLNDIGEAKETTAGILGEDAVAGFVAAEQEAEALLEKLDSVRQSIEDLDSQISALSDELDIVADQDTGAVSTTESIETALRAQAGQQ